MYTKQLIELYNSHKNVCCKCGCSLTASWPLGSVFVLDKEGNFYCTNCDDIFDDVDDRIFEADLAEEEMQEDIEDCFTSVVNYMMKTNCQDVRNFIQESKITPNILDYIGLKEETYKHIFELAKENEPEDYYPRTVIVELEINDERAIAADEGPIDYVERHMKPLEKFDIGIVNARVLDPDDETDGEAIEAMHMIFGD